MKTQGREIEGGRFEFHIVEGNLALVSREKNYVFNEKFHGNTL
jgi:hypothetical protein